MESRDKEINSLDELNSEDILTSANNSNETAAKTDAAVSFDADYSNGDTKDKKGSWRKELFTKGFLTVITILVVSSMVYIVSRFVPEFAEFWTRYPAQWIRFILAKLTGWIPFSVAEAIIVSLPILALVYIISSTVSTKRDGSNRNFYKWLRPLLSLLMVIVSIFFTAFGPSYGRNKLAVNLGLEQQAVSAEELYDTAKIVAEYASENFSEVSFDLTGESILPYDYDTLVDKMNDAFEKYADSTDYISHFSSNPKPIALSEPMTYTHISGVYTFMTGESNINTNYPDFLIPYTMAHEMAHQRGIAREDEANFVAFLVCIGSDDAYIRYSGYANMENYLLSALSGASIEKYREFVQTYLPRQLSYEFAAYSQFFDKYRESVASEVTGTVNNTFLQSQGQEAGTKSYGLVVDLAVAYYKK